MEVKKTPWEKRNLGVASSVEFYVGLNDTWNSIASILTNHKESYQIMHVIAGNTDVLLHAPQLDFMPIEMNLQLCRNLDSIELPKIYKRFENVISSSIANEEEKNDILSIIEEGNIFSTDKVARDPFFGNKDTGRRYAYWTQDVLDQGSSLLCMKYKGKIVAFDVCVSKSQFVAEAFLGGVLPEYQNRGLGFLPIYFITKFAMEKGYKKIITGVSSNNLPIIKLHEAFGYSIENMTYCLVKHTSNSI